MTITKQCIICGKEFEIRSWNNVCCSKECIKINNLNYQRSEKFKQNQKKYTATSKFKLVQKRYQQSEKGKDTIKKYKEKYEGSEKQIQATKRYQQSDKGKQSTKERLQKYYLTDNYQESVKKSKRKYRNSLHGRLTELKYSRTEKAKNTIKKYKQTEKYKLSQILYGKTPAGRFVNLRKRLKRRAAKMNIIETFTIEELEKKRKATNGFCACINNKCLNNNSLVGIEKLEADHIYSVAQAYKDFLLTGIKRVYTIDDIQFLCHKCNASKGDKIIKIMKK